RAPRRPPPRRGAAEPEPPRPHRGSRQLLRRALLSVAGRPAGRPPTDRGLPPAPAAAPGYLAHARPFGTSPAHAGQLAAGDGAGRPVIAGQPGRLATCPPGSCRGTGESAPIPRDDG